MQTLGACAGIREDPGEFRPLRSQVAVLHSQSALALLFPVLASAALCVLLLDISPRPALFGWTCVVVLYSALRLGLLRRYRPDACAGTDLDGWHTLYASGAFLSGAIWGAAPIVLIPYVPARLIEFTLYNGLIVLVINSLVAGAVIAYGVSIRVLMCFATPALLAPALYLIHLGDRYNSALGGFVLLYFLFIGASSLQVRRQMLRHIRVAHDYERAARELETLRRRVTPPGTGCDSPILYQAHFPPR